MKINLKKATSVLLAIIMVFSVFTIVPITASAVDNTEKVGVPLYQANIIANGYNNDGEGYYKLFKDLRDPLYYDFADYMLDDGVLCWTSNFWNAAFNSDFQKNPSYFYEVMLMGFLKYDQKIVDTSGVWDSEEMSLTTEIYNNLADSYIDKFEISDNDFLKQVDDISKEEVKKVISSVENVEITKDALDTLADGCSYATEFINAVSEYQTLINAKSERIELLKLTRAKVTDNEYFTKAVDDIIDKMEKTPIEYVSGKMLDKIWDDFLNKSWNLIIESSPIEAVLKAIDIEKMTLDVLFNSSETASNNFKLLVLFTVDTYFSSALEQAYNNYKNSPTVLNAGILIQSFRAYIEYQTYGLDFTKTFINEIVDGDGIHRIVEEIFFKESVESADELKPYCDGQIENREKILELLDRSADVYYSSVGLDNLVDRLGSENADDVNIPVTGISFKESEITLKSTDDICMIYADVYPKNATNKKVTYTSSDPSILSVPSDGGFASQKGKGVVTVTATTEDGDFTAKQTVNVDYAPTKIVKSTGKCGDNVYWRIYNDGTLYISGTGLMYDYSYNGPWGKNTYVQTVIISDGVTSIGDGAFGCCRSLTSINIPNSVTNIGWGAFRYCSSLTSINIPDGVTSICNGAFRGCSSLTGITIPDGVTSIGANAFYYCESLTSISIPDGVTSIGEYAFLGCSSLTSINIPNSVTSIGGWTFLSCTSLTSINIPDGVTSIGNGAFWGCSSLTGITIPDGVTSIGANAFYYCESLTSISIPDGVTSIGDWAFNGCSSLSSITIPDGVTKIGDRAFEGCSSLTSINIPDGVTCIEYCAFDGCSNLTSINIPDGVTSIGDCAFEGCSSLTSINIPDGVTEIGDSAFYGCNNLSDVFYSNSDTEWRNISIGSYNDHLASANIHYNTSSNDYFETSRTEADCTTDGVIEYKCHHGYTKTEKIPKLEHRYVEKVVKPTCAEKGYTLHTCELCGDTYKTDFVDKVEHSYKSTVEKQPTCSKVGIKKYTCTVCGYTYTEKIPMIKHTVVVDKAVSAKYTTTGKTQGSHCSVCGKVIKAQKKIPKKKLAKPTGLKATAKSKSFKLNWKKVSGVKGYEIQYSYKSNFSGAKKITVKSGNTTSQTVKKLTGKKKVYIRIRAYYNDKNGKAYSAWTVINVTTKK